MERPIVSTHITQHTLWQALTGDTPPLALAATPLAKAVLDNRDVESGDLFIALSGRHSDGHSYIGDALDAGAEAIICEERGREQAKNRGATIIDCTGAEPVVDSTEGMRPFLRTAFIVDKSEAALQRAGAFQRLHRTHPDLRVIGITGSVGKTSTKELAAAVLRQRYRTLHNPGNMNSEQGLPMTQLGLGLHHERAVLEMGMYALGEISDLCRWSRPHVGVITNIGPVHLEKLGTIERIQQAKSELIEALPSADQGGVAILNWDDELVRPMAEKTQAQIFRYGLDPEADLWADEIESAGMEGIRFRFHHRRPENTSQRSGFWGERSLFGNREKRDNVETFHVKAPLLGRHSVHTALRAAAIGLVEGLSWEEIIPCMQRSSNQLRLVVVPGINGSTVIDDTYNASPASTIAALNLLKDLDPENAGRRIAVLGDMLELGSFTNEGHKLVARRAVDVVDLLFTVGELGESIAHEARKGGLDASQIRIMGDFTQAITALHEEAMKDDLILVKGSRAVGMETIATEISNLS